jgi:hypothetical protein
VDLMMRRPDVLRRPPGGDVVARPGGRRRRRITLLGSDDAETYRGLVATLAPVVERSLGAGVMANRVVGAGVRLEDWRIAHRRWRRALSPARRGLRLDLDVADCYGSITPGVVAATLADLGAAADERLIRFLGELAEHGVPGLPVGPPGSAVLANAVLARLDRTVCEAGAPHVRWVDDLAIFVSSRRHADLVLDGVRRELASVGLRLQDAKTSLRDARIAPPHAGSPVR